MYKNLITALVQYERIETTINRCHDLSRVAERVSATSHMYIRQAYTRLQASSLYFVINFI